MIPGVCGVTGRINGTWQGCTNLINKRCCGYGHMLHSSASGWAPYIWNSYQHTAANSFAGHAPSGCPDVSTPLDLTVAGLRLDRGSVSTSHSHSAHCNMVVNEGSNFATLGSGLKPHLISGFLAAGPGFNSGANRTRLLPVKQPLPASHYYVQERSEYLIRTDDLKFQSCASTLRKGLCQALSHEWSRRAAKEGLLAA